MAEGATIRFFPAGAMPGGAFKRLPVPEGHVALLVDGRQVTGRRPAGKHRLGNWPRPAPDVVVVPEVPFDLRPRIQHLKSGDGEPLDLVWPMTLQVADPGRFYGAWLAAATTPKLALVDLEDALAGRLWDRVQEKVLGYALGDLKTDDQVKLDLNRALRPLLSGLLSELGLTLVGSQRPEPRTLEEEHNLLQALNVQERAARDARFEAIFERLEDKEMLAHRLGEWAGERGEPAPSPDLVDAMWAVVEEGPAESAQRAQRAAQVLAEKVAALERTLETERSSNERRFNQLVSRLQATERLTAKLAAEDVDAVSFLKRVLFILRLTGSALTLVSALIALFAPELGDKVNQLQFYALVVSIIAGALTILSDILIRVRVRRIQEESDEKKRLAARVSLDKRRQADWLVRARVEAAVKQVADSLEGSWNKGYAAGGEGRSLAVSLREVAHKARSYGEQEVRAANYQAGRYLAQEPVPDHMLEAVLNLDDELLDRSQVLARMAESIFEAVNVEQYLPAGATLREIENGLNSLRNRFTERGAYLMNPR